MIVYVDIVETIKPGSLDVAITFYSKSIALILQD